MTWLQFALTLAWITFFVFIGLLCIVWPERIEASARRTFLNAPGWVRRWPFANMVMKPWYGTYLLCAGMFAWTVAVLLAIAILISK